MEIFHSLKDRGFETNVVVWWEVFVHYSFGRNALIAAHGEQSLDETLELFERMQREGIKPDIITW